jgi:hypothetical protein
MAKFDWSKPQGDSRAQNAQVGRCRIHVRRRAPWDDSDPRFLWGVSIPEGKHHPAEPDRFFSVGSGVADTADKARAQAGSWLKHRISDGTNESWYCTSR